MDNQLKTILELNRDPVLAVEKDKLIYANAAALAKFPGLSVGGAASQLLPESILGETAEHFTAAAGIAGGRYTISASTGGSTRLYSLMPPAYGGARELLSDGMITDMMTSLSNLGLVTDRLAAMSIQGAKDPDQYLSILRHNYHLLLRQLTNLELAYRLREGKAVLLPRRTDLAALCADLVATVNGMFRGERAEIRFTPAQPELYANIDASKVERLLLNLFSNSLAHTPPDGEIHLRLSRERENAVLSLSDTGDGIPPDVLQNVFNRYECPLDSGHLDRAATAGLGLGVAGGIAELHGGAMIIESREAQGTTVRAKLPLGKDTLHMSIGNGWSPGMGGILTELSVLLDHSFYTPKYMD